MISMMTPALDSASAITSSVCVTRKAAIHDRLTTSEVTAASAADSVTVMKPP